MALINVLTGSLLDALPNNSKGEGFTHVLCVDYTDLTAGTAGDSNVFQVPVLPGTRISDVMVRLKTPFANAADAGNASTTVEVGDAESATQFVGATQVNANGAAVRLASSAPAAEKVYTAADNLNLTITPQQAAAGPPAVAAKALTEFTQGEVWVYLNMVQFDELG